MDNEAAARRAAQKIIAHINADYAHIVPEPARLDTDDEDTFTKVVVAAFATTPASESECPMCQQMLEITHNGFLPVHARSREEEMRDVNPIACGGSGMRWKPAPASEPPDYRLRDAGTGVLTPPASAPAADYSKQAREAVGPYVSQQIVDRIASLIADQVGAERERCADVAFKAVMAVEASNSNYTILQKAAQVAASVRAPVAVEENKDA